MPRGMRFRGRGRGGLFIRRQRYETKANLKIKLDGRVLRPRSDPSLTNVRPFKNQVIVFQDAGPKYFDDAAIVLGILTQNQITVNTGYQIVYKVDKVFAWQEVPLVSTTNVPQPLRAPFTLFVHSIIGESTIRTLSDYAAPTRYAKVGFQWPSSDRQATLTSANADKIFRVSPTDVDQNWIVHLHLLWTINATADVNSKQKISLRHRASGSLSNIEHFNQLRISTFEDEDSDGVVDDFHTIYNE